MIEVLDHSEVKFRHFCFPPDYYLAPRSFQQFNQDFLQQGVALATEALQRVLGRDSVASIDQVIYVTTTGLMTPSLEAHLFNYAGLRPDVRRSPLFGIGCAGGVNALAHARDFALCYPDSRTLILAVELCGQTFQKADTSVKNLIAASLFGDGVAAVLVDGAKRAFSGPRIFSARSELIRGSLDVMGWDVTDKGLELILSPRVHCYVRDHLPGIVNRFLDENALALSDIDYCIFHPGGPRILRAYQEGFGVSPEALRFSRHTLRCYGNISSASALFVLKDVIERGRPAEGEIGLIAAMGPGFAAELALAEF
ncbi:MAG: type III polyketide synthase [Acidobacteria bacterium]|nr:type III polyketide synthase [Acidobacteriota bacterium]